jgi:hypothetical protein
MNPKSLDYRLQYAVRVIQHDPNARVVIAVGSVPRAKVVFDRLMELETGGDFSFRVQSLEMNHASGSRIKVLPVTGDLNHYGGWQMSHLWLDETLPREASAMIATRQRSSKQHVEPPGIYDQWGVTRRMNY